MDHVAGGVAAADVSRLVEPAIAPPVLDATGGLLVLVAVVLMEGGRPADPQVRPGQQRAVRVDRSICGSTSMSQTHVEEA